MSSDAAWRGRHDREYDGKYGREYGSGYGGSYEKQYGEGLSYAVRQFDSPYSRSDTSGEPRQQRQVSRVTMPHTEVSLAIRPRRHRQPEAVASDAGGRALQKWPPRGYSRQSQLSPRDARDLIERGTRQFKGYCHEIPHASVGHYHFYATAGSEYDEETDGTSFQDDSLSDMSLPLTEPHASTKPWESLEQPSMAFCFGAIPGTVTLNHWVARSGSIHAIVKIGSDCKPRSIKLLAILDRLRKLEDGLEENDSNLLYRNLYGSLLHDPDKYKKPHLGMEKQIADLITVLSRSDWIDFSKPENQVVAKFFISKDEEKYRRFFLQLLLSVELYHRIHSSDHSAWAKKKLLPQLPAKIAWDLAVAQRWIENMSIEKPQNLSQKVSINFKLRNKQKQIEALRNFAWTLKWPNMVEIEYILEEKDEDERAVEDRSPDSMSWFTGVVLPGTTMPWVIMNSLIDCDRDTGDALNNLSHMYPNTGFQYRANTYWSWECIVGKVLGAAAGVNQIAGWIGPCRFTPDLKRIEIVRVNQKRGKQRLSPKDVQDMTKRSDPIGPPDSYYPVSDYELVLPDMDEICDTIRMEKLNFTPTVQKLKGKGRLNREHASPVTFDAAITFAMTGRSWPLRLVYDVSFVAAYPCDEGPHILFRGYTYRAVKIDLITEIRNWGNTGNSRGGSSVSHEPEDPYSTQKVALYSNAVDEVLVIEAFGVADNEVFARAWCSHWGLSAITANVHKTCMACAIREAYAACLNVVILTDGRRDDEVEAIERRTDRD